MLSCVSHAYLLTSGEEVVGEPVQRQTRGDVEREVSCNHAMICKTPHGDTQNVTAGFPLQWET